MTPEENQRRVNRLRANETNPNRKGGARGGTARTLGKRIERGRDTATPSGRRAEPRNGRVAQRGRLIA